MIDFTRPTAYPTTLNYKKGLEATTNTVGDPKMKRARSTALSEVPKVTK